MLERVTVRRSIDDRRVPSERRDEPRRVGQRRGAEGSVDTERRADDRRQESAERSGNDRRVGERRVMADRRMVGFA